MSDDGGPTSASGTDDMDGSTSAGPLMMFDHEPSRQEKLEMRKAIKSPSEWLRLLCKDWAAENEPLVDVTDDKFSEYKPYLKGKLTSQLLCRLSIPPSLKETSLDSAPHVDFWRILGISDEFDKAYIIAQVERFCFLYNIRGLPEDDTALVDQSLFPSNIATHDATSMAAAAAAGISVSPSGGIVTLPAYMDSEMTAAAAAAAAASDQVPGSKLAKKHASEVVKAHRMARDAEKALENERKQNLKKEQRRITQERKEQKQRQREQQAQRKQEERAQRDHVREERRRKKLELRMQREKFAQEQKELALKRAAELVSSNRVPIEITRGAAAAKAAAHAALQAGGVIAPAPEPIILPPKKPRSAIVVSTAADLHQIVTHSKNLWAKYNAIAKEHNQKVNWITVAKELGIHVKVREKYARMHSRAEQRGFDWEKSGHWKIKDHPEIFVEPTESEQKAKMPPAHPDPNTTVLIDDGNKEVITDDAVAAAAAVVDAAGMDHVVVAPTEEQTAAAAAVAATLISDPEQQDSDPTTGMVEEHSFPRDASGIKASV